MQVRHRYLSVLAALGLVLGLAGCNGTLDTSASLIASATGVNRDLVQSGADVVKSRPDKALQTFTPEQEYYLGRTVAVNLLKRYPPYDDPPLTRYINLIGQSLAQASDRPATFAGYHFLVLDTEEINAFAAPGGLIFVSRGILRLCQSEDEIAAVLAHEIIHVQEQHGIKAIRKKYRDQALLALGGAAVSSQVSGGAALRDLFNISVADVLTTLLEQGYSRKAERQADTIAVDLLTRVGYDPHASVRIQTILQNRAQPDQPGFAKTHPAPKNRVAEIREAIGERDSVSVSGREQRFQEALAGI